MFKEAINNAAKYSSAKAIKIYFKKENNGLSLSIQDNGKGFDWENKPLSFGLTLVERLVKDELKGELKYTNENGASFRILWS